MKRLLLLAAIAAVMAAPLADAHRFMRPLAWQSARLDARMDTYRLNHGRNIVVPSMMTAAANIGLSQANYAEAKWTTRIAGVRYSIWSRTIYGTTRYSAILKTIRCHGVPYTPRQALKSLRNTSMWYRSVMLWDGWLFGSARAVSIHEHRGWFKGKGTCRAYYYSFSN